MEDINNTIITDVVGVRVRKEDGKTIIDRNPDYPKETQAIDILDGILTELNGRRGVLDLDNVDEDIQEEIRERLLEIIKNKI